MTMAAYARDCGWRLHQRAAFIERGHSNIAADLREIALIVPADMKAAFAARQVEMLCNYGYPAVASLEKPFAYAEGIAFIPIHGLLMNRMSWSYSFATGYNFIRSQMNAALEDDDVSLIVYDVNSAGGLASGCKELADEMFASREIKPSLAVVDARCYSAAYFLASACGRVVVTPSGGVGSIGCAAMHIEFSEMLKEEGVKVTFIFAGDEKIDGNQYERLSTRARASIQRDVDYHYGLFVEAVARHRDLSEDDVRATEAGVYLPPEALELGLIDAVQTPAEAVSSYYNELTTDSETEDDLMTQQTNNGTAGAPATLAPAAAATAPAMTEADIARLVASGVATALAAEKTRAIGIRTSEEAKGREKLAASLIENTALSVDEARAILGAAGKDDPVTPPPAKPGESQNTRQAPNDYFSRAMDNTRNPNVGADDAGGGEGGAGGQPQPEETANRLLTNYAGMTGRKVIGINDRRSAA